MSYSCVTCGCSTPAVSSANQCPACCSDGGEVNTIIPAGKYVSVKDACNVGRLLENKECGILTSDGHQARFKDGSQAERIPLCNLRTLNGLNSILGLQGNDLAQIAPIGNDRLTLQYIAGAIRFDKFYIDPFFLQENIPTDGGNVFYAFLKDDGSGNYALKKFRCTIPAGKKKYVYLDENYDADCYDAWDLNHDATACVLYFWNKSTLAVEKLLPPTLLAGEAYSDYSLKLDDITGCPSWVKVSGISLPVVGRWTFGTMTAISGTDAQHSLSKIYDGGTPARFGIGSTIQVSTASQIQVIATSQMKPTGTSQEAGLVWRLNGVDIVPSTYSKVFSAPNASAPQSVCIWAGALVPGNSLSLWARSDGLSADSMAGSVTAISM